METLEQKNMREMGETICERNSEMLYRRDSSKRATQRLIVSVFWTGRLCCCAACLFTHPFVAASLRFHCWFRCDAVAGREGYARRRGLLRGLVRPMVSYSRLLYTTSIVVSLGLGLGLGLERVYWW